MKLKLFENFIDEDELLQSIKDCFQDLLDDDDVQIEEVTISTIQLCFFTPEYQTTYTFENYFDFYKNKFDFILNVKNCVERLKKMYDGDLDFSFEEYDRNDQFIISISKGSSQVGDFWKITPDEMLRFDFNKLREYLNLSTKNEINLASSGSGYKVIDIYFKSVEELDELKESVIKKLIDYKINNKDLFTEKAWVHPPSEKDFSKYKITRNYNRHRATGYYDDKKDIINSITFAISKDFDVYW
jgi:hypothetical protein